MKNVVDFEKAKEEIEEAEFMAELEEESNRIEEDMLNRMYMVHSAAVRAIEAGKTLDQVNAIIEATTDLYFEAEIEIEFIDEYEDE